MKSEEIKKIAKIFDRIATLMEDLQNNIKYHQSEYDELMNKKIRSRLWNVNVGKTRHGKSNNNNRSIWKYYWISFKV